LTQSELDEWEIEYMRAYRERGVELLNVKEGGDGGKFSEEAKRRMKGRPGPNLGRRFDKEWRKNMSSARLGVPIKGTSVVDISTGETYISVTGAAKAIGMKRSTLQEMLRVNGKNPNKTSMRYVS